MSQVVQYYNPLPVRPLTLSTQVISGTTFNNPVHSLVIKYLDFVVDKPVNIIDDEIEVNETLLEENHLYPLTYRGEQYYARKSNNAVEIFQLEE